MESAFLLDVIIRKRLSIFKLLACEDESLLIGRNAFLVLNLLLHVFNRIRCFSIKGNRLTRKRLYEDLHTATEAEDKMQGAFLLDVVIRKSAPIFKLLACEDESLLIGRNAFLVLNLLLHVLNRVRGFSIEGNGLASECLYEDLHL